MYYDLIYTRCRYGVDILHSGQPIRNDGFKIYACSSILYKSSLVDLLLVMNSLQKKQSLHVPDFMDDAYLYTVPDIGLKFLNVFHPVPYDLSVTGDFSKTPGMYLNHAIVGDFEEIYPFETFHDRTVWTAQENNEAYYYEQEPSDLSPRELVPVSGGRYSFSDIGTFIREGRQELLKKAVAFLIEQFRLPPNQRKYLIIKDESSENIEMWIAAVELAFSPKIASNLSFATRMDKFASTNIYYVDDAGLFSQQQQNSEGTHTRLRAMIVGVVSKDKSNTVRTANNSSYVVLDGEKKTANFDSDISGRYYGLISGFNDMHERFSREFLQSFEMKVPCTEIYGVAESYDILCGSSFGSPGEYAKALNIISKYKFYKTDIICEIYGRINEKMGQFIKSGLDKSLPILNWLGNASEVMGDCGVKERISGIIAQRALEVFFTEYKKGSFSAFWEEVKSSTFSGEVSKLLSDEEKLDEYVGTIRMYEPEDAVLFLEIYCKVCKMRISEGHESAKMVIAHCITACGEKISAERWKQIMRTLKTAAGSRVALFLLDSVKTYEPETMEYAARHLVECYKIGNGSMEETLSLCKALSECGMERMKTDIICRFIKAADNIVELELLAGKASELSYFSGDITKKIYALLDEKVAVTDMDCLNLALSIQKNRPRGLVCVNSAHLAALYHLCRIKRDDYVEECIEPYAKQGFPTVREKVYVSRLVSAVLKLDVGKVDHEYILELLLSGQDVYLGHYMSSLVADAELHKDKWKWTILFAATCPDTKKKRKIERTLSACLDSSGLKKKNMDALGALLVDKKARQYYDMVKDEALDRMKENSGSAVIRFFGRLKK